MKKDHVVKIGSPNGVIGMIGVPDEEDVRKLSEQMGKPIRMVKKKRKTILWIGDGLFKKRVVFPHVE